MDNFEKTVTIVVVSFIVSALVTAFIVAARRDDRNKSMAVSSMTPPVNFPPTPMQVFVSDDGKLTFNVSTSGAAEAAKGITLNNTVLTTERWEESLRAYVESQVLQYPDYYMRLLSASSDEEREQLQQEAARLRQEKIEESAKAFEESLRK